jgi:hypothetical protein
LILLDKLPRKTVNIHAPLSENVDAMMSIQYSSFPPSFQTTLLPRQ